MTIHVQKINSNSNDTLRFLQRWTTTDYFLWTLFIYYRLSIRKTVRLLPKQIKWRYRLIWCVVIYGCSLFQIFLDIHIYIVTHTIRQQSLTKNKVQTQEIKSNISIREMNTWYTKIILDHVFNRAAGITTSFICHAPWCTHTDQTKILKKTIRQKEFFMETQFGRILKLQKL